MNSENTLDGGLLDTWDPQAALASLFFCFIGSHRVSISVLSSQERDGNNSFKRFNSINITCFVLHNDSHRYPGVCDNSDFDRNPLVIIFDLHTSSRVCNITENTFLQLEFIHANCSGW